MSFPIDEERLQKELLATLSRVVDVTEMTPRQIADVIGVSVDQINCILTGLIRKVSITTLASICIAAGVKLVIEVDDGENAVSECC